MIETNETRNEQAAPRLLSPLKVLKASALELTKLPTVCAMAVMLACCYIFSLLTIPALGQALQIKFSFLIYALCGALYGPVPTMLLGVMDQLLIETLMRGNGFLLGYVLSFAFRGLLYGFALYHRTYSAKGLTVTRVALTKTADTALYCILLNTYLNYHYGFISAGSFSAAVTVRIGKNIVLLPLEIFLLCVFLGAMLRALPHVGGMPAVQTQKITKKQMAVIISLAVLGLGLLLAYLLIPSFREALKFGL